MQNFLTARYRQVHDKIKIVRLYDLRNKLAKTTKDIYMLSILEQLSSASKTMKDFVKFPVSAKILQFPYAHYWRKHWIFKCCLIGMLAGTPLFYKIQASLPSAEEAKYDIEQKQEAKTYDAEKITVPQKAD